VGETKRRRERVRQEAWRYEGRTKEKSKRESVSNEEEKKKKKEVACQK
jgi:hypothetical protein